MPIKFQIVYIFLWQQNLIIITFLILMKKFFNFLSYFSLLRGDFLWQTPAIFMGKFLFLNSQLRFVACSSEKSKLMTLSWVQGGLSLKTVTILLNQSKHSYIYITHGCLTLWRLEKWQPHAALYMHQVYMRFGNHPTAHMFCKVDTVLCFGRPYSLPLEHRKATFTKPLN